MTESSLIRRAIMIYSEDGLLDLLKRAQTYIHDRAGSYYEKKIESLRRFIPKYTKQVELNGVVVPIHLSWIEKYAPYYKAPYPTENNLLYEHVEGEAIRHYCEEEDDVVIIGGGLGVTTVIASRVTGGNVTVFEQSEETCEILKRTLEVNNCSDTVTLYCAGVGTIGGSNLTHKSPSEVDIIPPADLPSADVYEMDCEGSETMILKNMDARPRRLLIETHNNHDEIVNILNNIGYIVSNVVRDGKAQHHACTHIRARRRENTPSGQ